MDAPQSSRRISTDLQTFLAGFLRIGDVAAVVVTGILAYRIRELDFDLPGAYQVALALGALLTLNYFHFARLYRFANLAAPIQQFGRLAVTWIIVIVTLIFVAYFTKTSEEYSRIWVVLWFSLSFAGFLCLRFFSTLLIRRWQKTGQLTLNLAIVGANELGLSLANHLAEDKQAGVRLAGFFDDQAADTGKLDAYPVLGTVEDLLKYSRDHKLDEVIVAMPWSESERLLKVLKKLRTLPISIYLCPEILGAPIPIHKFDRIAGWPMLAVQERPLSGWDLLVKTIEDYILGSLLLVLLTPLMIVIAIAIKLDSAGPIFFHQRRYGFNNNLINVYKFRTMYHTEESRTAARAEGAVPQAKRNDPRVTRVGGFLRRTSLDELPQLFNVLQRQMSLVGPRPHAVVHNEQYAKIIDDYFGRHRMKPGITGWAQVNGFRGETSSYEKMQKRVHYDLYYVDNWSLFFDLKILFLTFFVPFMQENAY
ncbi:MAG: undecaprenyl-phosphate glucose phosphotransferase [Alphaproteobacteria bacterium]|nr:undecaprenyl-phosphate glucose phosphotransferase [Alphaproteobacteria bacterium]